MITTPSLVRTVVTLLALVNHKVAGNDKLEHRVNVRSALKSDVAEYAKMTKVDGDKVLLYWNVNDDILDARVVYKGLAWLGFGYGGRPHRHKEVIIGKPQKRKVNKVRKYWLKGNRWSEAKRMDQRFQTLGAPSLVQDGSTTTMSFKKRMEEDNETAIKKKGDNEFFVVIGSENRYHKIKNTVVFHLDLSMDVEAVDTKSNLKPTQAEATKTDAKAKAKTMIPQADEMKKPQADDVKKHTHKEKKHQKHKGSKRQGLIFVIVGSAIGAMSLLSLVAGMIVMRRQTEHAEQLDQIPLMDDIDEVKDLE